MLKKHSQFFENLLFLTDILIILLSWLTSYYIRFSLPAPKGVPGVRAYIILLIPITLIWGFAFKGFGLYRPKRIGSRLSEVFELAKACVVSVMVLVAFTYFFFDEHQFSRLVFLFFTAINIVALTVERGLFRGALSLIRMKGYNLRYAAIVGKGEIAGELVKRLEKHPEVGIKIEGIVSTGAEEDASGLPVLGHYHDLKGIVAKNRIDIAFIALPWEEHAKVVEVLGLLEDEPVDINVIPDLYEFATLKSGVEEFDGIPILNLRESPLWGWNLFLKRLADIMISLFLVVLLSPLMLLIAILIKLTSRGPLLYRQERMGIGGDIFKIIKFRTMREDAEGETGAVWAVKNDPRRTLVGALLRRASLDELPQVFNVLCGNMSLVGPRPERPVFIQEFRKKIPRYMLRHRMKAGITGWAQVNGWRGNTDMRKRIEHDLYYIENWSLAFDLKIIWLTIWKGLINRNAY